MYHLFYHIVTRGEGSTYKLVKLGYWTKTGTTLLNVVFYPSVMFSRSGVTLVSQFVKGCVVNIDLS